jgi:hypothetical protein
MINPESNVATVRHCSNCGSSQVRRTHRSSQWDTLCSKMNLYPYYCQDCDVRSYRLGRK